MRLPITPLGWVTALGALLAHGIGWWLGWIEFVAVGLGCLLVLVVAIPFVIGSHGLVLSRELDPNRVSVGDPAASLLVINNTRSRKSAPRVITDSIGGNKRMVDVPGLVRQLPMLHRTDLPTGSRGVVEIGPADITKGDPLGVLRRSFGGTGISKLWVHPRYIPLTPLQSGFVKDLEGPTYDTSPAGDVAFHTIREYVPGDDVRHIHWMSTARTGSLMIRHYVDNRRPYLGVLVDPRLSSMEAPEFEVALEIAASMVVSAALETRPVAVWVGDQAIVSHDAPADRNTALDRLCLAGQSDDEYALIEAVDRMRQIDTGVSAVVLITGELAAEALLPTAVSVARQTALVVTRCCEQRPRPTSLPRATLVDVLDVEDFATRWQGLVR